MCANVDQMMIVIAVRPPIPPLMLDSHIIAAVNGGIAPVILVNKCDLEPGPNDDPLPDLSVYQKLGYEVVRCSTKTLSGMDDLREALKDSTSILVGQSGVGKTSLVNALLPDKPDLRVSSLSNYSGLGAHTTTHAELHHIASGGELIDCAGFRDFGTWHFSHEEIQEGFEEVAKAALECKYKNCRHRSEPECSVQAAVKRGDIAESRLEAFHSLTVP